MNADEARAAEREARIKARAERLFVAAAATNMFSHFGTDEEAAGFAFEVAEAFERVSEARGK